MEDGRIVIPAVHPDKIRMDEAELVGLFNVVAPTLRAAKKRIYKLGILQQLLNTPFQRMQNTSI